MRVRIGTRGSKLAIVQTQRVIKKMKSVIPNMEPQIEIIKTSGDIQGEALGSGMFVNEINQAVLLGKVDIGIHSLKDLPTKLPEGLTISCVPERLSPNDVLISRYDSALYELPSGAIVGVSCPRRRAELKHLRQDLRLEDIRGNIDTRIQKMKNGNYDAIVVALAALERLGLEALISQRFDLDEVVPAAGQGALAVVCREGYDLIDELKEINDEKAWLETCCERFFLEKLGAGCSSSAGAVAKSSSKEIELIVVTHRRNRILLKLRGKDPRNLGEKAALLLGEIKDDA